MNKKNLIIQIYAYLVAFSAVVCLSITSGMAIYSGIGIVSPETTMDIWRWEQVSSFEKFKLSRPEHIGKKDCGKGVALTDENTLQKLFEEEKKNILIGEKRIRIQNVIHASIIIVISIVLFITHWKLGERLRKEEL